MCFVLILAVGAKDECSPIITFIAGMYAVNVNHPNHIQTVLEREGKWPIGGVASTWPFVRASKELDIDFVAVSVVS